MSESTSRRGWLLLGVLALGAAVAGGVFFALDTVAVSPPPPADGGETSLPRGPRLRPRKNIDTAGFILVNAKLTPWPRTASLEQIASAYRRIGFRLGHQGCERLCEKGLLCGCVRLGRDALRPLPDEAQPAQQLRHRVRRGGEAEAGVHEAADRLGRPVEPSR